MRERVHAFIDSFGTAVSILHDVDRGKPGGDPGLLPHADEEGESSVCSGLAAGAGKLYNIHPNDGEGSTDDGLMVGTVNFWKTVEVMYHLKNMTSRV